MRTNPFGHQTWPQRIRAALCPRTGFLWRTQCRLIPSEPRASMQARPTEPQDPYRHRYGFGVFAIMAFRDPIEKRSSASLFQDQDRSARAQADAGSEPRDPFWWLAVLATRAAFAARPAAKLVSIPLNGGSLRVSVGGGWRASTSLPDDVAAQLDLYLPYCFSRPGGLAVAHIGQSSDGRIASEHG